MKQYLVVFLSFLSASTMIAHPVLTAVDKTEIVENMSEVSLQDISKFTLATAGGEFNDLEYEKYAASDVNRDPTVNDYADFKFTEEKIRSLELQAQELEGNPESAEMDIQEARAFAQNWKEVLKQLVSNPKFNQADDEKLKLFKWTISENQPWTFRAILESGFDPIEDWEVEQRDNTIDRDLIAIESACVQNRPDIVALLLDWKSPQGDTFVDPTFDSNLLLHNLCDYDSGPHIYIDHTEVVRVLLEWRKEVLDQNNNPMVLYVDAASEENKAIQDASRHGHAGIVDLLLRWKSPPDSNGEFKTVNPSDGDNDALQSAVEFGYPKVVRLLLQKWDGLEEFQVDATDQQNSFIQDACFANYESRRHWYDDRLDYIDIVEDLLNWVGPDNQVVDPTAFNNKAFQYVEENINRLIDQSKKEKWKSILSLPPSLALKYIERNINVQREGEKWKSILSRLVSNPNVDQVELLKWANLNKHKHTIAAINAQKSLKRQVDEMAESFKQLGE